MTHKMVFCKKLKQELPGLDYQPYPGDMGRKVYEHISAQAWNEWLQHQTMLINEYRLNLIDPKTRPFLEEEMQKFLFEGGNDKPAGYVPPSANE